MKQTAAKGQRPRTATALAVGLCALLAALATIGGYAPARAGRLDVGG